MTSPLTVGQIISIPIEKLVDGGAGLGRWEGRVVFVPGVCPGEEIRARVTSVKKGYATAELQTVLKPSPDRVAPPCPVFGKCGGCQWQQLAYPAQVRAKSETLRENLRRIGKQTDPDILPPLPAANPLEYRTRIQLKTDLSKDGPAVGYYAAQSHRLVPIESCPIAGSPLNNALAALRSIFSDPDSRLSSLTDIHLHLARGTGELQARYFAEDEPPGRVERVFTKFEEALPNVVSQVYYSRTGRRWVRGRDYLMDRYLDIPFRIADRAFAQVNREQTLALIETVRTFARLTGRESVLELYCGIGTLGIFLAREASTLVGYDENEVAVEDANYNARQQGLTNCRFTALPVDRAVEAVVKEKRLFDRIVLDPPREGLDRKTLESLAR
ncbi:MAG: 23S rRNA (uracil(1939)-C(5))-methyltransferase RlmD, partial [Nitrospirae bacterium]|nr:23S rRNA (uracil(1939)-C(5))-methyltransferase RlmD [Nitrospirota bacterium]